MKKVTVLFFLFLCCGSSFAQHEPLDQKLITEEDLVAAAASFGQGNATNAVRYYKGILAGLVHIDQLLASYVIMDEADAPVCAFIENIVQTLSIIKQTKESLKLYKSEDWILHNKMEGKTLDWLNSVEGLMDDYMVKLAEPLSRADETWSEDEYKFYDKYLEAYDKFLAIDDDQIAFQYLFAEENDFTIEGEIVIGEDEVTEITPVITEEALEDKVEYEENALEFARGEAVDGEKYFEGILAAVVLVDADLRNSIVLDDTGAGLDEIMANIKSCLVNIETARASLALYTTKTWPLRSEFHDLTLKWLKSVEGLMTDYLTELAEPMSRPDSTWSQAELDFYETYIVAYDEYLKVDSDWVDYQYVFAAENGFEISGTIDVDSWNGSSETIKQDPDSQNEK